VILPRLEEKHDGNCSRARTHTESRECTGEASVTYRACKSNAACPIIYTYLGRFGVLSDSDQRAWKDGSSENPVRRLLDGQQHSDARMAPSNRVSSEAVGAPSTLPEPVTTADR
jgi:hypothetical protein